jgi:diguanylate cyclase (GGDEF)-like protein
MSRLKAWWNRPDQFDWTTELLRQRGLLRPAQKTMAVVNLSSLLVPLTVLPSQRHLGLGLVVIGGILAVFAVGMTVFWLTRWPTRRQSQAAVVMGVSCIAGWSLTQPSAALAVLGCAATALPGGYAAFLHGPKLVVFNGVVALAIITTEVPRLAREANLAAAVGAFWLICFINIAVPLAIAGMSQALGTYAQRSEEDPLTGLLNRRAFTDAISARVASPASAHTHLAVVMVDLDHFKRVNDTHGHLAGDLALREVAGLLREHAPPNAIICRAGGEEFLVALTCVCTDVAPLAAGLCTAVATLSREITASIGTASGDLHLLSGPDAGCRVEELIASADRAMYAAKRHGGNQAYHSTTVEPIGTDGS